MTAAVHAGPSGPEARDTVERWALRIKGTVQGVGFRPHVYQTATSHGLAGWVLNSAQGVTVEVEGPLPRLHGFLKDLLGRLPRLARVDWWDRRTLPPAGYRIFEIRESLESPGSRSKEALVSPDVAICPDCRREIQDPADRRYRYPFTNCTNCGPRFTIIEDVPYDRAKTTMKDFPMCPECAAEYRDPGDRRFHAQPNACPDCGPRVELVDRAGIPVTGDWLGTARRLLAEGRILAVKGVGGFHLACDATDEAVVAELRRRKRRPAKPFAVMARDAAAIRSFARLSPQEEELLGSPAAPIVILDRREGTPLAPSVAPNLATLGVMIPYTPLHCLLFGEPDDTPPAPDVLVMTSGNVSDLPLVKDNAAALRELSPIADYFLLHNRDIRHRCDDSLARVMGEEVHLYRRSRGYVPQPLTVPVPPEPPTGCMPSEPPVILGAGAEIKNTFCLLRGDQAFLSPHIGEVAFREGLEHYGDALESMESMVYRKAEAVAYDLHPGYEVSMAARRLRPGPSVGVQHHHAHLAAVMGDNGLTGQIIGIIADGTGYGDDGAIWGGEVLAGGYEDCRRLLHLAPVRLPGGDRAVEDPVRMALAHLVAALGPAEGLAAAEELFPHRTADLQVVAKMIAGGFNAPWTTSCGRLFDAVSALLGITEKATYEGQAAVELSELAESVAGAGAAAGDPSAGRVRPEPFPVAVEGETLAVAPMVREIAAALRRDRSPAQRAALAARFQESVVQAFVLGATEARRITGLTRAGLSGGVFQNRYVLQRTVEELGLRGFEVYYHHRVPANDGGLSLGQALVARWRLKGK